jgi:hypothetical protein
MAQYSYGLKRAYLILWRWQASKDGALIGEGWAMSRTGALALARRRIRNARPQLPERTPEETDAS